MVAAFLGDMATLPTNFTNTVKHSSAQEVAGGVAIPTVKWSCECQVTGTHAVNMLSGCERASG